VAALEDKCDREIAEAKKVCPEHLCCSAWLLSLHGICIMPSHLRVFRSQVRAQLQREELEVEEVFESEINEISGNMDTCEILAQHNKRYLSRLEQQLKQNQERIEIDTLNRADYEELKQVACSLRRLSLVSSQFACCSGWKRKRSWCVAAWSCRNVTCTRSLPIGGSFRTSVTRRLVACVLISRRWLTASQSRSNHCVSTRASARRYRVRFRS